MREIEELVAAFEIWLSWNADQILPVERREAAVALAQTAVSVLFPEDVVESEDVVAVSLDDGARIEVRPAEGSPATTPRR
jgi:hypothetical protein